MLNAKGLTKSYGQVKAVSDVSLSIGSDMIYGIIGPNGAGKSTLFRLLSGFERPQAGTITFNGRRIESLAAHQRARQGIVRSFQELELFPELTAGDVLTTAALLHDKLADAREHARAAAATFDIPWNARATELNPGMIRRIELARCILARPKVVLFDEVMAGLTIPEAEFMCENIKRLHETGVAIVIVEHVMHVVRSLCRHIYVMAAGQMIAQGAPDEVARDPAVTAAYLGTRKRASFA
jgi:ABC-type branched-subunit amino acid transport system ATPase component